MSVEGRWSVDGSDANRDQAGVGVFMQQDQGDTRVYVKKVVPGGSAARSARVEVGDIITHADGVDVSGEPVSALRKRIVGPQGTYVRLGFRRADKFEFEVNLMRGTPEYLSSLSMPLSGSMPRASEVLGAPRYDAAYSAEVESMRQRVRQLEAQRDSDRLEVERLRALLQGDRDTSLRYVKEIDHLQRKHGEEIMALQAVLNKSEQQRRELEAIVQGNRVREEDLKNAALRTKESLDGRELQLSDLRRAFEEERTRLERELMREKEGRREDQVARSNAEALVSRLQEELKRGREIERARREREERVKQHISEEFARLNDARVLEEKIMGQTQELHLMLGKWESDFFGGLAPAPTEQRPMIQAEPAPRPVARNASEEQYFLA